MYHSWFSSYHAKKKSGRLQRCLRFSRSGRCGSFWQRGCGNFFAWFAGRTAPQCTPCDHSCWNVTNQKCNKPCGFRTNRTCDRTLTLFYIVIKKQKQKQTLWIHRIRCTTREARHILCWWWSPDFFKTINNIRVLKGPKVTLHVHAALVFHGSDTPDPCIISFVWINDI